MSGWTYSLAIFFLLSAFWVVHSKKATDSFLFLLLNIFLFFLISISQGYPLLGLLVTISLLPVSVLLLLYLIYLNSSDKKTKIMNFDLSKNGLKIATVSLFFGLIFNVLTGFLGSNNLKLEGSKEFILLNSDFSQSSFFILILVLTSLCLVLGLASAFKIQRQKRGVMHDP